MVEFIEVLHVAKDDVLLIDDSWRNLLNSTGHLPLVGLQGGKKTKPTEVFNRPLTHFLILCKKLFDNCGI